MAIRLYKPTTPARRGMTSADTAILTKRKKPEKSLLVAKKSGSGRNNQGKNPDHCPRHKPARYPRAKSFH